MNGERVKFMGHLGKSKESVVAGTREPGNQCGKQAPEDGQGQVARGLGSQIKSSSEGVHQDLSQPPALPLRGHS